MKKYFVLVFLFLISFHVAHAALEITEIMYDPKGANAGHQWIEVYNSGTDSVSIDNTWRFNDGSSHYINDKDPFVVPPQFYFILTGSKDTFLADHPSYSGTVIDTSMSLHKDGDTISLLSSGETMAEATYTSSMGGSQNDNSLQKIHNTWVEALPTPGIENVVSTPAPVAVTIPTPVISSTTETPETTSSTNTPVSSPPETQTQNTVAVIPVTENRTPVVNPAPSPSLIPAVSPTQILAPIQSAPKVAPIPLPTIVPAAAAPAQKKSTKRKVKDTTRSDTTTEDPIDLSMLGADAAESKTTIPTLFIYSILVLIGIIIVGVAVLVRKKKNTPQILPETEESYEDIQLQE